MSGFFSESEVSTERPSSVPKCGACKLYRWCQSPKMGWGGKGKRGILLVTGFPEEEDDESGVPFSGPAGEMVREQLALLDVDMERDTWQTYALICRPPSGSGADERVSLCRPSLVSVIETLQPTTIVLLGPLSVNSFMPLYWKGSIGPLERWLGWEIPSPSGWVVPSYAPGFLLARETPMLNRAFALDLEKAVSTSERGAAVPFDCKGHIHTVYDERDIETVIRQCMSKRLVAIDYETNCLKPEYPGARIYSCALSDGEEAWSFPWSVRVQEMMGSFFRNKEVRKIAANLKFEERWTRRTYGHGVSGWAFDTMLGAHCLDNRPGICSLKFQSWVRLGVPTYNEHIETYLRSADGHHLNRIHEIPLPDLLYYGGMDALLEYRLATVQRKELL